MSDFIIGLITGIPLGTAVGIAIEIAIGIEEKPWSELSDREKKIRKNTLILGIIALILGVISLLLFIDFS